MEAETTSASTDPTKMATSPAAGRPVRALLMLPLGFPEAGKGRTHLTLHHSFLCWVLGTLAAAQKDLSKLGSQQGGSVCGTL